MISYISPTYYLSALLLLILSFAPLVSAQEQDPSLMFQVSGRPVNSVPLSGMKSKLKVHEIEFVDPMYGKLKRYEGFSLSDVIELGFGDKWRSPDYTDIAFTALDGYEAVSSLSRIREPGGYIVFRDLDSESWEPVGNRQQNPGPLYIVWTGAEQTTQNEYPWPWQLARINLIRFKDAYPLVYPDGAEVSSGAYSGYEIFKGRCVRCHSMNKDGGKIGPDLNAPQSIVTYRSPEMIKEFIKNPSKYRYTQMPDHPDLTESDLDNLLKYFIYMNENRS
jgi:mono/diheme cytochrome c family protein